MKKINCLNPIAKVGLDLFSNDYEIVNDYKDSDAILVRSAAMHEMELPKNVCAVARAGAGVNNIPLDKYAQEGVVVFNTPGANANGVKELVLAGMLLASRDIVGGVNWVNENKADAQIDKTTEKAKKAFGGTEILGKKLGVIGLGAIGVLVANAAVSLGMTVYGCDPFLSVDHALKLNSKVVRVKTNEEIYENCDFISVHVPLMDSTKKMINEKAFNLMKPTTVVLNFARDLLVDEVALKVALENNKIAKYVTDFPNTTVVDTKNIIVIPHLGASTEESEDNCAKMAVIQIADFLENGNITNSVNYPQVDAGICQTEGRIAIAHKNVPNTISQYTTILASKGINIVNMVNKSKGDYAYTVLDIDGAHDDVVAELEKSENVFKVRIIK